MKAVVFDFDGLICDSEWPIYEMAATAFRQFEVTLEPSLWADVVGLADDDHDWFARICERTGAAIDRTEFDRCYRARDRSWRDRMEPMPGVVDLIADIAERGVPRGIASSSTSQWVEEHLLRMGLRDRFDAIVGFDHTGVGKPAPDVYVAVCKELGVEPADALALEDSAHGVAAAKAAGMWCIAVPNRITVHNIFTLADGVATGGLAGLTFPDLLALLSTP